MKLNVAGGWFTGGVELLLLHLKKARRYLRSSMVISAIQATFMFVRGRLRDRRIELYQLHIEEMRKLPGYQPTACRRQIRLT